MKLIRTFCLAAIVTSLLFSSCKKTETSDVKLVVKNFEGEVNSTQNLSFTFSKDLVPVNRLEVLDTSNYITFEPRLRGYFKWVNTNELKFFPYDPFPASTQFTGTINSSVTKLSENKYNLKGETTFEFNTPLLKLTNANLFWVKSPVSGQPALQATATFNTDVDPGDLESKLQVEMDGVKLPFTFRTLQPSTSHSILIEDVSTDEEFTKVNLIVEKGLSVPTSDWATPEKFTAFLQVPESSKLTIEKVEPEHDGFIGSIYVTTSQELNDETLEDYLSFDPEIEFTVEKTSEGLKINSDDFEIEKSYELTVSDNLKGSVGGQMEGDFKEEFSFGKLNPIVKFVDKKAMYLPGKGNRNVAMQVVGVPKIRIEVTKIFENNILAFMRKGRSYDYQYVEDESGEYGDYIDYEYYQTNNFGKVVYETEMETGAMGKKVGAKLLNIDFSDKLPEFDGIYVLKVHALEKNWLTDTRVMSVSDIGMIVKATDDRIMVFCNSIRTANALSGVKVSFISNDNQKLYTATTGSSGIAIFDNIQNSHPDFNIALVTASNNVDYNFVQFNKTKVNTSRFATGGKYPSSTGYDAFFYGERNLYRPGETINLACVVRTNEWEQPGEMPVKVKLLLPNGNDFKTIKKTLTDQGGFEASFELPLNAVTGTYYAELYTANDTRLASQSISVEEFMPDRIKVNLNIDNDEINLGEELDIDFTATNFFGPPAANRNYELEATLSRSYFTPKGWNGYTFNINKTTYFDRLDRDGSTDEDGNAEESLSFSDSYEWMGLVKGRVFVTVFDETGRPVSKSKNFKLWTQDKFYGIGNFDYYTKVGTPIKIPYTVVDKEGRLQQGDKVKLTVIKKEYRTVLEKSRRGTYTYYSQPYDKVVLSKDVTIKSDNNQFYYTADLSGRYEVRIGIPGTNHYVTRGFSSYGWGSTEYSSFEVSREGNVEIDFDKESYKVGETVTALIRTPFAGKLLVTVERDKVIDNYYINTDKKTAEVSFVASGEFVPNIFVSATLIRPMDDSEMPLFVAHGFAPAKVEDPNRSLSLDVEAVEKSRSQTKQTIKIETDPFTEVTVAVVDEGVLQIKNYVSPDPFAHFYASRALQVGSYDIYPFLFPEITDNSLLSGGGGGDYDLEKRVNPLAGKRVKLVSFWSGIIETGGNGLAEFEIDIPEYSGELRIMAVGYNNQKFAAVEQPMTVADPVVLSTALPRFLSPGDTVKIPVTISNTTGTAAQGNATISVTPPMVLVGGSSKSVTIPANKEQQIEFKAYTLSQIDVASVNVKVNALGETFKQNIQMPVRPATSLQKKSDGDAINGGENKTVDLASNFIPSSVDGKLVIANSPMVEFSQHLEYLVRYPHGCLEQTVSAAFPQLYFSELSKQVLKDHEYDPNPNYNVRVAIQKIKTMQMSDGSLAYWPRGGYASWWGTVYSLHFLYEAKKAGFDVDDRLLKQMSGYLKKRLRNREKVMYYYNSNQKREIAPKEVAYSLYVLALMDKADISTMNYYKANSNMLSLDAKYLLAAAYKLAGDENKYKALLPSEFIGEISNTSLGGSFYSWLRDMGIVLNTLVEVDENNPQIPELARIISKEMKSRRYMSTQERIFALLAFGKIAKASNRSTATAEIYANGKKIGDFNKETVEFDYASIGSNEVEIKTNGDGKIYYFWDLEGLSNDNSYTEEDKFLKVRRTMYDRDGDKINPKKIKINDLVVVEITLVGMADQLENIVISDILPAGFEIENSRLNELPNVKWIKNQSSPDHVDIRDDRIHIFTYASKQQRKFYYMVRAVSKGEFVQGPVSADAMYNGEYHSYHGGGKVTISDK